MIYLVGTLGFIFGFFAGQIMLLRLLRGVPNDELLSRADLRWKYGLLNWVVAILTAAAAVWLYGLYLPY